MADLVNHPGMFLNDQAAASLKRLEDDHGVQPVTSAGRTPETQQGFIDRWDKGGVYNRPPYLYEPARPKETSSHVKNGGEAVDVTNWRWWRDNAAPYGWVVDFEWDVVHFRYDPSKDIFANRTKTKEDDEMKPFLVTLPGGRWALVMPQGNDKPRAVTLQGNAGARAVALFGEPIPFDQDNGKSWLAQAVNGV